MRINLQRFVQAQVQFRRLQIIEFKPGNGTTFCLEGEGDNWVVTFGWRPEHPPG